MLSSEYLKVGYSKDVPKRLCAYNTCNPDYILLDVVDGSLHDESEFHKLITPYHYKLEWYKKQGPVANAFAAGPVCYSSSEINR